MAAYYLALFQSVPPPALLDCTDTDESLLYIERSVTVPTTLLGSTVAGGQLVLASPGYLTSRLLPLTAGVDYQPLVFDEYHRQIRAGVPAETDIVITSLDGSETHTLSVQRTYGPSTATQFSLRESACPVALTPLAKTALAATLEQTVDGVVELRAVHWLCTELYSTDVDVRWLTPFVVIPGEGAPNLGFSLAAERKCHVIDGVAHVAPITDGPIPPVGYHRSATEGNVWYSTELVNYNGTPLPRYKITVTVAKGTPVLEERTETFNMYVGNGNMLLIRPLSVTRTKYWET